MSPNDKTRFPNSQHPDGAAMQYPNGVWPPAEMRSPDGGTKAYARESEQPPKHGTRDKINRLRVRAKEIREPELRSLFLGMLDLMADEL